MVEMAGFFHAIRRNNLKKSYIGKLQIGYPDLPLAATETECNTSPRGKVLPCPITNSALKIATIQIGQLQGLSQRAMARILCRSPATISRELRRNTGPKDVY
jgi:hypothetical protein